MFRRISSPSTSPSHTKFAASTRGNHSLTNRGFHDKTGVCQVFPAEKQRRGGPEFNPLNCLCSRNGFEKHPLARAVSEGCSPQAHCPRYYRLLKVDGTDSLGPRYMWLVFAELVDSSPHSKSEAVSKAMRDGLVC
jgi:hypothetical protein